MSEARSLFLSGDIAGSIEAYAREIGAEPGRAAGYAGRAAVRLYAGDRAGSREDTEKALSLDPGSSAARLVRARLLESESRRVAIEEATRAVESDPGNTAARYWRAIWRDQEGDPAGARADLAAVAGAEAPDADHLQVRAQVHLALGAHAAALRDFDGAIAAGATLPFLYFLRGLTRGVLQDRHGAVADFTRVLEVGPQDPAVLVERGRERALLGEAPGALSDFNRAIDLEAHGAAAFFHRGWLKSSRDPLGAREDYVRAAADPSGTTDAAYFRGLAFEALGRPAEARDSFRQARASAPLNHPRRRAIEAKLDTAVSGSGKELLKLPLRAPATFTFLAVSIGVWLVQGDLWQMPKIETLISRGALVAPRVWDGEYWRLVSAMFLHIGALHLFWNMYGGFSFCVALERLLGTWRFAVGYLLSGIGASAVSLLGHFTVSAGSSGALFGALGMVLAVFYSKAGSWRLFLGHPPVRRMLRMIVLWFVLGLTVLPMDNFAHFGGMVFGAGFGLLFTRGPVWGPAKRRWAWVGILVFLVGVSVSACIPRPGGEEFVAEVRVLQADTEAKKGQFKKALAHYDEAVALSPRNPGVVGNRGYLKLRMGDLSGARRDLQAALDMAPRGWTHEAQLRETLRSLRPDREY